MKLAKGLGIGHFGISVIQDATGCWTAKGAGCTFGELSAIGKHPEHDEENQFCVRSDAPFPHGWPMITISFSSSRQPHLLVPAALAETQGVAWVPLCTFAADALRSCPCRDFGSTVLRTGGNTCSISAEAQCRASNTGPSFAQDPKDCRGITRGVHMPKGSGMVGAIFALQHFHKHFSVQLSFPIKEAQDLN